jgi:hypothetical protein
MGRGQAEATTKDLFSGVLGRRRGAKRDGEDHSKGEALRAVVASIRGSSNRVSCDDGEVEARPICSTVCFRGQRAGLVGWELEGRLFYVREADEWLGAICSGTLGSKLTYPVARGKSLSGVLAELGEAVEGAVGGRDDEAPLRPSGEGPVALTVGDVERRIEQARGLGLLPLSGVWPPSQ